jgi:hypothetical protein
MNVYSKNQQFRLFNSVKYGKNNPLIPSTTLPYDCQSQYSYSDLLRKSLISFIEDDQIPKLYVKNKKFHLGLFITSSLNSMNTISQNLININIINDHIDNSCLPNINTNINTNQNISHSLHTHNFNNIDFSKQDIEIFTNFVENMIKSDPSHQGYIHSCLRGSYNKYLIFFNIGGNYRYCPKKNTHHQHNTVAIMINTKNCTYAIRCKDGDCNNSILVWKKIQ